MYILDQKIKFTTDKTLYKLNKQYVAEESIIQLLNITTLSKCYIDRNFFSDNCYDNYLSYGHIKFCIEKVNNNIISLIRQWKNVCIGKIEIGAYDRTLCNNLVFLCDGYCVTFKFPLNLLFNSNDLLQTICQNNNIYMLDCNLPTHISKIKNIHVQIFISCGEILQELDPTFKFNEFALTQNENVFDFIDLLKERKVDIAHTCPYSIINERRNIGYPTIEYDTGVKIFVETKHVVFNNRIIFNNEMDEEYLLSKMIKQDFTISCVDICHINSFDLQICTSDKIRSISFCEEELKSNLIKTPLTEYNKIQLEEICKLEKYVVTKTIVNQFKFLKKYLTLEVLS